MAKLLIEWERERLWTDDDSNRKCIAMSLTQCIYAPGVVVWFIWMKLASLTHSHIERKSKCITFIEVGVCMADWMTNWLTVAAAAHECMDGQQPNRTKRKNAYRIFNWVLLRESHLLCLPHNIFFFFGAPYNTNTTKKLSSWVHIFYRIAIC